MQVSELLAVLTPAPPHTPVIEGANGGPILNAVYIAEEGVVRIYVGPNPREPGVEEVAIDPA